MSHFPTNPFSEEYRNQNALVSRMIAKVNKIRDSISWYQDFSPLAAKDSIKAMATTVAELDSEIRQLNQTVTNLEKKIAKLRRNKKSMVNPFNWFDSEQASIRARYQDKVEKLKKTNREIEWVSKNKNGFLTQISSEETLIDKHAKIELPSLQSELDNLEESLKTESASLAQLAHAKKQVDDALNPVLEIIDSYEKRISKAETAIVTANRFIKELEFAENGYERSQVHQECEDKFDTGSPNHVLKTNRKDLTRFKREREKSIKRAEEIILRTSRQIKTVIIDGNNICYEGCDFIGLKAILPAVTELSAQYSVVVVFDASIRGLLRLNNKDIKAPFPKGVEVHIVATKQTADETILDIASDNQGCFILSNDRFGEFLDKPAVAEKRLIRHEVVGSKLFIRDLNINLAL